MLFMQIALMSLIGIATGTFTGLMPGIHINLIAVLLLSFSGFLLNHFSVVSIVSFIIAMAITHTFLDFIPSIFLGAPNPDTALSVLPGHRLLLKGRGYAAVRLTTLGCYIGLISLIFIMPLLLLNFQRFYDYAKAWMPLLLFYSVLFIVIKEKKSRFWAVFLFLLSGVLGIVVFNLPVKEPLLPLLTGLFGTSMLIESIKEKSILPEQKITKTTIQRKRIFSILPAGIVSSLLCSFLPGLGSSQAAVIGGSFMKRISNKGFLVLLGLINILVAFMNFIAIYAIGKPRSGVAVVAARLIGEMTLKQLILFLIVAVIAGGISVFISLFAARIFARNLKRMDYSRISALIILLLCVISFLFSGLLGLLILITATSIGIVAIKKGVMKTNLMGCIILPVIFYFL